MIIRIDEIQSSSSEFELRFDPSEFDSLGEGITLRSPVQSRVHIRKVGVDIDIKGQLSTALQLDCSRCLEPQIFSIQNDLHVIYRDVRWVETAPEVQLEAEDMLVSYYAGDTLNLLEVAREQILLAIPLQFICKMDCAGLCPQCGQNRNLGKCSCREDKIDPRLAVLTKLLQN